MKVIDGRTTEPFTNYFNRMVAKRTMVFSSNGILNRHIDCINAPDWEVIGRFDSHRNAVLLKDEFYEQCWQDIASKIRNYELVTKGVEITLERTGYYFAGSR